MPSVLLLLPPTTLSPPLLLSSSFTPSLQPTSALLRRSPPARPLTVSANATRSDKNIVRFPALDRRASAHNRLRFVRKLSSLLLTKRLHFLPLRVLRRCAAYLRPTRPVLPMVLRYPTIFRVVRTPPSGELAVALTPAALSLARDESSLRSRISSSLASKLQKLLLLSSHRRLLLLSKLAHLAPDLGLPRRFRSSLLPLHPDLFRVAHTSYGPALELLSFDPSLAAPLPPKPHPSSRPPPIIDRPPRFTPVRLRRGLNLKRRHAEYLARFAALPEANPYAEPAAAYAAGEDMVAEKRACAAVREVLAMMVERRTLVDHLTHFRTDFGLPNRLRAMLVRHPEMFYVSVKGKRDSVFLVDGYDEDGKLVEEDELVKLRGTLAELVREGKRMRRERRKKGISYYKAYDDDDDDDEEEGEDGGGGEEGEWGLVDEEGFGGDLEGLFESGVGEDWEDWSMLGEDGMVEVEELRGEEVAEFWRLKDRVEGADAW